MIPDILTSCHINWRIAQRSIVIINPLIPCRSISSSNHDIGHVRPMPWRPWRPPRGWSEFVPWKHTLNRISHLSEAESYFCSFFPPNTRHGANQCRACWLRSEVCSGSPLVISTFDFYSCYKWAIKSGYNPLILTNLIHFFLTFTSCSQTMASPFALPKPPGPLRWAIHLHQPHSSGRTLWERPE